MAEELKDWFDRGFYKELAGALADEHLPLDRRAFVRDACRSLEDLSLLERLARTASLCRKHLPDDYPKALGIVSAVAPRYDGTFKALFAPEFVARYGRQDRRRSLQALRHLTHFGSAEFAIRHFMVDDFDDTLAVMTRWARDDNHQVRRLASEGCRPRLLWLFQLK
tara:strand:+ start:8330 stop:8827 length:498 start_codon:yes stop_codon:yes gene_type:complete